MPISEALQAITVSAEELADVVEVDRRTIYRHAAQEGLPRVRRGEYPLVECVQYYVRKLKVAAEMRQGNGAGDQAAEADRRRLVVAQAEKYELENRATRGELIEAELVGQVLTTIGSIVSTQVDALGPRTAARLSAMTDPAEIILYLRDECATIREAVADELERLADSVTDAGPDEATATGEINGGDDPAATEADGGGVGGRLPDHAAGVAGAGPLA